MICLDTNYLILGLVPDSREGSELIAWRRRGERFIVPMPGWYEFICGPVGASEIHTMLAFVHELVPFSTPQALEAARLFNAVGRRRILRFDAMIAATAISAGASLATNNQAHFKAFIPHGLTLAELK